MLQDLSTGSCLSNIDGQSGTLFLTLLNTLLASQCALRNPNLYPEDASSKIHDGDHFDFIVVGAGSAGSVVGSRLVKTGKWKVLVVEAGGFPSVTTEIPMLFSNIDQAERWNYYTEPANSSCLGFRNGTCYWPRGKVLGGCSTINAMLYIRGNKGIYDLWASQNNEGWDSENVMKYFKMSEKLLANDLQNSDSYGKDGLLPLTKYTINETLRDVLFESFEELGYPVLEEEGAYGFFESLQTIEEGVRANTAKVFFGSVRNSDKLTLSYQTHVKKIIFVDKQAKGVEIMIGGKILTVFADKEVILSAGAINTPQILMLSGIGPKKHLQKLGIKPIHNLRVVEELQDHLALWLFYKVSDDAIKPRLLQDELYKYFAHKGGELSTINLINVQGFLKMKNNTEFPEIQYSFVFIHKNETANLDTFLGNLNIGPRLLEEMRHYNEKYNIFMPVIILMRPKSRGKILLRSDDAFEPPIIHSGYLTDHEGEDIETTLRAIRTIEALLDTQAFQRIEPDVLDVDIINCKHLKFRSDDYWRCYVRNLATTLYHPTSTCRMGPARDKTAVVDSRLRVHGVGNLRVIDASIMPNITSGNTNAPTIMIGQLGSQMVIDDHKFLDKEDL